eukprot:scaffold76769_cov30-Tisochrysis_lutea.AAC.1
MPEARRPAEGRQIGKSSTEELGHRRAAGESIGARRYRGESHSTGPRLASECLGGLNHVQVSPWKLTSALQASPRGEGQPKAPGARWGEMGDGGRGKEVATGGRGEEMGVRPAA